MARLIVYLREQERHALDRLAQNELRLPRAQAALIIRQELKRLGMLQELSFNQEVSATGKAGGWE